MSRKLFILFVTFLSFTVSCQNTSVAQIEPQISKTETERQETPQQIHKCEQFPNHGSFVFTGQVKEILPYQERRLSKSKSSYYQPKAEFEPLRTIRFAVNSIYGESGKLNIGIKEIVADVMSRMTEPALSFKIGETYLVYATPRYYGKYNYNLEDHLIIYPDTFTQPISQAQERIRSLENPPRKQTPNEMFSIDPQEFIVKNGIFSGKATRIVQPKYPEDAKTKKARGLIRVAVLVNEEGNVVKVKTLCTDDESFVKVSEEAALQSHYTPTLISGKLVKMSTIIVYNFVAQ